MSDRPIPLTKLFRCLIIVITVIGGIQYEAKNNFVSCSFRGGLVSLRFGSTAGGNGADPNNSNRC